MDLRIFTEPQQGATYGQLLAVAKESERLGFDAFFRSDHYVKMGSATGLPGPTDAWITLAGIARETTTIRLGTLMTAATFRFPGPLAIAVAQVDEMSGGRVELGLGAGWFETEHAAYGIPFPPVGERFDRFEEQIAIVLGLWETPVGETFSYSGHYYQLADSPALPKPVQTPRPPLLIGGRGPKRTPALAAAHTDEYNFTFSSPEETAGGFERVRAACEQAGRDPGSIVLSAAQVLCVGQDEAEFTRRAAVIGREPNELRESGLAGTVDEVVDKVRQFGAIGATRLYLQVLDLDDLDHIRLVGEQVMPNLG